MHAPSVKLTSRRGSSLLRMFLFVVRVGRILNPSLHHDIFKAAHLTGTYMLRCGSCTSVQVLLS